MRERYRRGVVAALASATLLLVGCGDKETGPDPKSSAHAPDISEPVLPATAAPDLAKQDLGFSGTDTDGDGLVSPAEYAASSSRIFSSMDTDDDGTLTVPELDAARRAMRTEGGPSSEKLVERA